MDECQDFYFQTTTIATLSQPQVQMEIEIVVVYIADNHSHQRNPMTSTSRYCLAHAQLAVALLGAVVHASRELPGYFLSSH
jgi:hypothetical protein